MRPKSNIKHAVVLVNYRGYQDTLACIASIKRAQDAPHIVVVDNGSDNESVAELTHAYPDLDLLVSPTNLGFSGGNNLGIKRALKLGAQVIYLLNNDTEVEGTLFARSYRYVVGKNRISGGKIYYAKGYEFHDENKGRGDILWYAGGDFDWNNILGVHHGVDQRDHGQYDQIAPAEFITGCFMAIPRQVIRRVGLLDESLFLYLEDADYCLRASRLGVELRYHPRLVLYHKNSSATVSGSALVDYYLTRNRLVIAKRYGSLRLQLALIKNILTHHWADRVRRAALFDYLWGRMGNQNEKVRKIASPLG